MTPKELLFKHPLREGNKPLFDSQVELAKAVIQNENISDQEEESRLNSIKVFINQCVNGKRKLPDQLERQILSIIDSRIAKDIDFDIKKNLRLSFDRKWSSIQKENESIISFQSDYDRFLKRSKKASSFVVSTCEPAETKNTDEAESILEETLKRIGVLERISESVECNYYFPAKKIAEDFWEGLFKYARKKITGAGSKLLEANEKELIKVYISDPKLTIFPIVVLDIEDDDEIAFFVSYNKYNDDKPSVAVLSREVLRQWKSNIYKVIKENSKQLKFNSIYENYKSNQQFM